MPKTTTILNFGRKGGGRQAAKVESKEFLIEVHALNSISIGTWYAKRFDELSEAEKKVINVAGFNGSNPKSALERIEEYVRNVTQSMSGDSMTILDFLRTLKSAVESEDTDEIKEEIRNDINSALDGNLEEVLETLDKVLAAKLNIADKGFWMDANQEMINLRKAMGILEDTDLLEICVGTVVDGKYNAVAQNHSTIRTVEIPVNKIKFGNQVAAYCVCNWPTVPDALRKELSYTYTKEFKGGKAKEITGILAPRLSLGMMDWTKLNTRSANKTAASGGFWLGNQEDKRCFDARRFLPGNLYVLLDILQIPDDQAKALLRGARLAARINSLCKNLPKVCKRGSQKDQPYIVATHETLEVMSRLSAKEPEKLTKLLLEFRASVKGFDHKKKEYSDEIAPAVKTMNDGIWALHDGANYKLW